MAVRLIDVTLKNQENFILQLILVILCFFEILCSFVSRDHVASYLMCNWCILLLLLLDDSINNGNLFSYTMFRGTGGGGGEGKGIRQKEIGREGGLVCFPSKSFRCWKDLICLKCEEFLLLIPLKLIINLNMHVAL